MVGNMRKCREDGLYVGAGAGNRAGQEGQRTKGQRADDGQVDPVSIGSVISDRSEKRQKRAQNQFASRQLYILVMDFIGNRLIAAREELPESKQLQLFCAFLAGAQDPQIVQFAAGGGLLHAERISEEREFGFRQKFRHDANDQGKQDPRGDHADSRAQAIPC